MIFYEFEELANIAMLCLLMGVGIFMFIGMIVFYFIACEFFETCYLETRDD